MARQDDAPGLPIKLGACSNGEFAPIAPTPVAAEAVRRAWEACAANARRVGMSRRRFLRSTMGAATTLFALQACSKDSGEGGGRFDVPPDATTDPDAAQDALGGDEPIIDVQNHLLEYADGQDGSFGDSFPQSKCGQRDSRDCFTTDHWLEEVFLRSDTTVAVLSAIPVVADPDPLSAEVMAKARAAAERLCGDGRVLVQGHATPNLGAAGAALDAMRAEASAFDLAAWKAYTHVGPGWTLDDHAGAAVGERFLALVEELGPPIVCVHKGLSGGAPFAAPDDIGPAAAAHPDIAFVVYHSAYETGVRERGYDRDDPNGGADRLVATLERAGIGPGANVYAELGSTWRQLIGSPDEAAHLLGKLLLAVGEDNILWGTDSIWYGSPQDQIQAFRAFQITERFQEEHGYLALTPERKAKILAGNAARLYGIDPATAPCRFDRSELEQIRLDLPGGGRTFGPTTLAAARATFVAEHPWFFA